MDEKIENTPEKLPLELELDLLVDEELPEARRRELLRSLDKAPGHWRELSIRFLERQMERRSARQLIAAGSLEKALSKGEEPAAARAYKFPGAGLISGLTPGRWGAIAAGLLVLAGGIFVVPRMLRPADNGGPVVVTTEHGAGIVTINTRLPGSIVGADHEEILIPVSVQKSQDDSADLAFFPRRVEERGSRRSVVIQPNGTDNALVIPVKGLQFQ